MRRKTKNDRPYLEVRTRVAVRFHDGALLLASPPFIQSLYRQWEPLWIRP